ncbi:MAG: ROK family protein [Terracidiphilus sp.]|jgi:glucokinase
MLNVGVDVGGTNIKFGVIGEDGKILLQEKTRTEAGRGSRAIVSSIIQGIDAILHKASLRHQDVNSIGLGVPGTADAKSGVVVYAPNLFWRNVEIVKEIQQVIPLPVFIAQDTRASAWAEYLIGAGQGLRGVAGVTLGTGVGCGMVFDGRIFHGALNTAGEFGHQIVELDGHPCNCGRRGCLETYAGGLAIVRDAEKSVPAFQKFLRSNPSQDAVQCVYQLAHEGDAQARQVTDRVVRYVGMGLVNLININSVDLIAISGGISNAPSELLLDPLIEFVRNRAYESVAGKVRICRSALGEDAPLIGAALLYRESSS